MMRKAYQLMSRLPAAAVIQRLEGLFTEEGVQYRKTNLSITSVETPIAIFGIQSKLYSKKNWVGLNPFAFVSGVDVRCEQGEGGVLRIDIRIDQFRTLMYFAMWVASFGLAASGLPVLWGAILLIAGTLIVAWLVMVSFLGGFLIKKEIRDCLNLPL